MNKKIFILLTTASFILGTNLFLVKSSAYTKIHNNHLFFTGIHNVSFTVKQHCISSGQPYATPDGSQASSVKYLGMVGINIRAGRYGSKGTVDCTSKNLIDSKVSFYNNFTFYLAPKKKDHSKLNFAVKGTLVIYNKFFDGIILAQGHSKISNNWWFGGNKCYHVANSSPYYSKEQVECTARDGTQWCFARGITSAWARNSPDHVQVKTHRCVLAK